MAPSLNNQISQTSLKGSKFSATRQKQNSRERAYGEVKAENEETGNNIILSKFICKEVDELKASLQHRMIL